MTSSQEHAAIRGTISALQHAQRRTEDLLHELRQETTQAIALLADQIRRTTVPGTDAVAGHVDALADRAHRSITTASTEAAAAYDREISACHELLTPTGTQQHDLSAPLEAVTLTNVDTQTTEAPSPARSEIEIGLPAGGPGGDWEVYAEEPGAAVQQITPGSCVSAVGEMLTNSRITQETIHESLGDWSRISTLVQFLSTHDHPAWRGGYLGPENIDTLNEKGQPWAAEMFPETTLNRYHHLVLIDGVTNEHVVVRDPWEGSSYRMTRKEFDFRWSGNGVTFNG